MRNPRYNIDVAYITECGKYFGKLDSPQLVTYTDMDLILKVLDPMNCQKWFNDIKKLPRGGFYKIQCVNHNDKCGQILKQVTIIRN